MQKFLKVGMDVRTKIGITTDQDCRMTHLKFKILFTIIMIRNLDKWIMKISFLPEGEHLIPIP